MEVVPVTLQKESMHTKLCRKFDKIKLIILAELYYSCQNF